MTIVKFDNRGYIEIDGAIFEDPEHAGAYIKTGQISGSCGVSSLTEPVAIYDAAVFDGAIVCPQFPSCDFAPFGNVGNFFLK